MIDPSHALQKAVYEALIASGVASGRVFSRVPDKTPLPFVYIGQDQIIGRDDAADFSECFVTVDAYAATLPELKLMVGTIRQALHKQIELDGFTCCEWHFDSIRYIASVDESTEHAVIELSYLVLPA